MNPVETLFYTLGELAYAMAVSDGKLNREEKEQLHAILLSEFGTGDENHFGFTEVIFHILQKDAVDVETAYENALKNLESHRHYLTGEMRKKMERVLRKVAEAFPPVSPGERNLLERIHAYLRKEFNT